VSFPQVLAPKLYALLLSPICCTCPTHLILFYLVNPIIFWRRKWTEIRVTGKFSGIFSKPGVLQRWMRQCTDHVYWISRDLTYSELLLRYLYPDTEVNYSQYRVSFELVTYQLRRPAG
jgi:hypothetical protein